MIVRTLLSFWAVTLLAASFPAAPAGTAFYSPPALGTGVHGDLIWSRALDGGAVLPSAARNELVLYRTTAVDGSDVAVSGMVAIPKGTAPRGGWPVVTWAHGTTGDGLQCAPSRYPANGSMYQYLKVADNVLDDFVAHGYAVVQTDYEGQGTPGVHPYLVGEAEGRDTIDIVRAARQLDPNIGTRYVVLGHSQGGHSAIFAASLGQAWAPELTLLGVVALAPASQLGPWIKSLPKQSDSELGFGFAGLLIRAYASVYPDVRTEQLFVPAAAPFEEQLGRLCAGELFAQDSWGGLIPAKVFAPGADLAPLLRRIAQNDPGAARIAVPALLVQGSADDIVPAVATEVLDSQLCDSKTLLTFDEVEGANHINVIWRARTTVRDWVDDRFAGKPAASNCAALNR
jgi:pimeloyl-ACP methyl ester carboxylesterase